MRPDPPGGSRGQCQLICSHRLGVDWKYDKCYTYYLAMPASKRSSAPKQVMISVRLDQGDNALLQRLWERDGVAVSEQIRRGLRLWFKQKGLLRPKQKK